MTLDTIMTRNVASVSMDDTLFAVRELFEQKRFHHAVVREDHSGMGFPAHAPPAPGAPTFPTSTPADDAAPAGHGSGRIIGVISDRDLLRNISPFVGKLSERRQDVASLSKKVHQVMTRRLVWAAPTTLVEEAAGMFLRHGISCLPVLDEAGRCVGIVTPKDIMRWLAESGATTTKAPAVEAKRKAA